MSILDELAAHARERVAADREAVSLDLVKTGAQTLPKGDFPFERALRGDGLSFICEIKRASPSRGMISPDFPYLNIAREYESAHADCISVLTEPKWFLGSDDIFRDVRVAVKTPIIRKDFVVDEYQIYQAKTMGADAVLLICAITNTKTLSRYIEICDSLGLSALVETHDAGEIESAVAVGARMIGVNNRNLRDFTVDFDNAARLRDRIPPSAIYVAESGVKTPADAAALRKIGANAALVGESLMRAEDKRAMLSAMREAAGA